MDLRFNLVRPLFAAILVLLLLASAASAFQGLQPGMEAADFSLKDLQGNSRTFRELRGERMTAVIFWSTWSSKSEALLARMEKLYREKRGEGLSVVAINADEQHLSEQALHKIRKSVDRLQITFPVLLDDGLTLFHEYGVIALPSTLLLDRDRIVRYQLSGNPLMQSEKMLDFIIDTLSGKKGSAAISAAYQPNKVAVRFFNMGKNTLKSRRTWDEAEKWFQKAVAADSNFIPPRLSLGKWYLQKGDVPQARREYEQVLAKEPANIVALCEIGMIMVNEGKGREGENMFTRARQTEDAYTPCYYYAGYAKGKAGQFEEAEAMFAAALKVNPRDVEVFAYRGRVYDEAGNPREAAGSYRKALEIALGIN